jgi:hypothetical protein
MVGAAGFEPATLWSQTRCATRLRYAPMRNFLLCGTGSESGQDGGAFGGMDGICLAALNRGGYCRFNSGRGGAKRATGAATSTSRNQPLELRVKVRELSHA